MQGVSQGVQSAQRCSIERDGLWCFCHGQPAALHHLHRHGVAQCATDVQFEYLGASTWIDTLGLWGLGDKPTAVLNKLSSRPPREGEAGVPKSPL